MESIRIQTIYSTPNPRVIEVGECIYSSPVCKGPLEREHVVPFGLGGGLILLNASCKAHESITGKFEGVCLQQNFGIWRYMRGLPSRNKKGRPTHFPMTLDHGTHKETRLAALHEHPTMLILPTFAEHPSVLVDGVLRPPSVKNFKVRSNKAEIAKAKEMKAKGLGSVQANFALYEFIRLLAKMAHGVARAEYGKLFEPALIELIEGVGIEQSGYLVGSSITDLEADGPNVHGYHCEVLEFSGGLKLVAVNIRLFADLNMPSYTVIAGSFEGR